MLEQARGKTWPLSFGRDTCTLVLATEAREGPNTQDGIELFMALRRQRDTRAWC